MDKVSELQNYDSEPSFMREFFVCRFLGKVRLVVQVEGGWGGHSGQVDSCHVVFELHRFHEVFDETLSQIESFLILSTRQCQ